MVRGDGAVAAAAGSALVSRVGARGRTHDVRGAAKSRRGLVGPADPPPDAGALLPRIRQGPLREGRAGQLIPL